MGLFDEAAELGRLHAAKRLSKRAEPGIRRRGTPSRRRARSSRWRPACVEPRSRGSVRRKRENRPWPASPMASAVPRRRARRHDDRSSAAAGAPLRESGGEKSERRRSRGEDSSSGFGQDDPRGDQAPDEDSNPQGGEPALEPLGSIRSTSMTRSWLVRTSAQSTPKASARPISR